MRLHDMDPKPKPFLTAKWRHLVLLNFEVDPAVLRAMTPAGTELDLWQGKTLVSVVGFLFLNTRILGVPIPFHRNFEEVNLRFYVRRQAEGGWRRGVVFIKELAPRRAVVWTARMVYGENYVTLPMGHHLELGNGACQISYWWTFEGKRHQVCLSALGPVQPIREGSEEEFITEHYWGYTNRPGRSTIEYQVEHPRWQVRTAAEARLECDAERLYGQPLGQFLRARPSSAFLADGSAVTVYRGTKLTH